MPGSHSLALIQQVVHKHIRWKVAVQLEPVLELELHN